LETFTWLGNVMVRMLDLQLQGCWFESRSSYLDGWLSADK